MANKKACNEGYKKIAVIIGVMLIDWLFVYAIYRIKNELYAHAQVFERQFSIFDESISHPYMKPVERIKWYPLLHQTLTYTSIIIIVVEIGKKLVKREFKNWNCLLRFLYDTNQAILGLFLAYLITNLFSDYIKNFAGRYRPDFLTVCDVDFEKVKEQLAEFDSQYNGTVIENFGPRKMFNTTICRGEKSDISEEQKSFPSGHASFAFTTMTYLTLYLAGQFRLMHGISRVWKYFIVCCPLFFATYVPFSRLMDYRHHWEDVTVGSLIGLVFGISVYYIIYPKLRDDDCDTPHTFRFIKDCCCCCKSKKEKIDEVEEDDVVVEPTTTSDEKPEKPEEIV